MTSGATSDPSPVPSAHGVLRDSGSAARLLSVLYVTGATLGLVSMLLPQPPGTNHLGIYVLCLSAYAVGIGTAVAIRRTNRTDRIASFGLGCGTVLITLGIAFTGQADSVYSLFYVWIGLVAFFLFSPPHALAHVALVAATYGALILPVDEVGTVERWAITTATVLVVGWLVGHMRRRVEMLVGQLETTVERLAEAATTDALTGLLNRRGFNAALEHELRRARRTGRPFALILCDLDRFKRLNDTLGHPSGDAALTRFAVVLAQELRPMDTVARTGGEEFAVLLPETGEEAAHAASERLRLAIEAAFAYEALPLTVSCGVTIFPEQESLDALMQTADAALYAAKQLGRNRTVVHRPGLSDVLRAQRTDDRAHLATMLALAEALDLRDTGTARHSHTVGRYAELMAEELGLGASRAARLRLAGLLHDVGKIAIPDSILRKPGKLTEAEWEEMRRHPETGARLLGPADQDLRSWVLAHHERVDGGGYPRGLTRNEIPLEARILAVADAYEAMTADRVYRDALGAATARAELLRCAGTQFDPEVVDAFLRALDREGAAAAPTLA